VVSLVPAGSVKDDPATMFVVYNMLLRKARSADAVVPHKVHPPQGPLCETMRKRKSVI